MAMNLQDGRLQGVGYEEALGMPLHDDVAVTGRVDIVRLLLRGSWEEKE